MRIVCCKDEIFLFDPKMTPWLVLSLWIRVDLCVLVTTEYSTFPKAPELKPHHQMYFCVISRTWDEKVGISVCTSWNYLSPQETQNEIFFAWLLFFIPLYIISNGHVFWWMDILKRMEAVPLVCCLWNLFFQNGPYSAVLNVNCLVWIYSLT